MQIIKFSLFNHCDLQYFDHSWIFFFRYTFWFAMVVCHFLFTSTQFARLFSSKISRMSSLNVGNRSKTVCIVKFCKFWILVFFTCNFKWLFGFRFKPMSPLNWRSSKFLNFKTTSTLYPCQSISDKQTLYVLSVLLRIVWSLPNNFNFSFTFHCTQTVFRL